jgi:hypothetical protein
MMLDFLLLSFKLSLGFLFRPLASSGSRRCPEDDPGRRPHRIFAKDSLCGNRVTEDQEDPRSTGKTHVLNSTYKFRSEIVNTTYNDDQKSSYTDYIHFNATYNDEQKSSYSDYIQLSHAVTA